MPVSLDDLHWPVRTERLTLRRGEPRDAASTFAFRTLPEVAQWLTVHSTDLDEWERGFSARLPEMLIAEKDGVVVGDLMLRIEDAWSQAEVREQAAGTQAEIGYCFDPAYAGRGYATEASHELLRIGFEELGVHRVTAFCFADNTASWRLMERLGMRREQHAVQDSLHRNGEWLDGMMYAVLDTEWRARRG